ncbi:hypothetical protein [Kribbella sp.]|uniref:hypothetical protein n=1 Tax=Kribbella sp. TaxID=1871183 RepID=UPI002D4FBA5C|nr:hypothetical protein [Kribbella sp.]HZX06936.1 hypothetical protein [Kribbella sp.]
MGNQQGGYPPPDPQYQQYQQPPYQQQSQQPQYAQQPQYPQQPQFGPGPYASQFRPPRRGRGSGGLAALIIVLSVIVVLLLVGAGILLVTPKKRSTSGPVTPSSAPVRASTAPSGGPTVPSSGPTDRPSTNAPKPGPVPCAPGANVYCLRATVASASALLKSKGVTCAKTDDHQVKCVKGGKAESIEISLEPDALTQASANAQLSSFGAMTFSNGPGAYPQGRAVVIKNLQRSMKTILQTALPGDPTAAQVTKWMPTDLEKCTNQFVKLAGYEVKCDAPTRFSVQNDNGKTFSSWSVSFTIMAG